MRQILPNLSTQMLLPVFAAVVPARAPGVDYREGLVGTAGAVPRPADTFYIRLTSEALAGAGLLPGDLLVIDPQLAPAAGAIVVVALEDELLVRRLASDDAGFRLDSDDPTHGKVELCGDLGLWCWGVAVAAMRPRH